MRWIGVGGSNAADSRTAGAEAIARAVARRPDARLLVVLASSRHDLQALVTGVEIPLVGCTTAGEIATDGVVVMALGEPGFAVSTAVATDVSDRLRDAGAQVSAGNREYELDDRPALDVDLERLRAPVEARRDPAAFTRFALTHPLGLNREDHVRFVGEADFTDRSLGCIAEVPQGAVAWFMAGDAESVLSATDQACAAAVNALDGAPARGVVAFDRIARRAVLGEHGIAEEVERIGAAPVAGFYTYGEIARTRGISGFHNQTLVVLALA